jgi:uncharacterized protein involved in exopolysaccharide biosynthesis/Mrp family chromosome partitioning ATPase
MTTPIYTATVLVLIKPQQAGQPATDASVREAIQGGPEAVPSEVIVLQSRDLARKTIEHLRLEQDAEFNESLNRPKPLARLFHPISVAIGQVHGLREGFVAIGQVLREGLARFLSGAAEAPATSDGTGAAIERGGSTAGGARTAMVDALVGRLNVAEIPHSNVIQVSFKSTSATTAAAVPNTLVHLYVENQVNDKSKALEQEIGWLNKILPELRQKMLTAEFALAEYRRKSGLVSEKSPAAVEQEFFQIRSELAAVRARKAEAAARLSQVQQRLSRPHDSAASGVATGTTVDSPVLERLREREVDFSARLSADEGLRGSRNPQTLDLDAQLSAVRRGIRAEAARVVRRLKADLAAAEANEATLQRQENQFTHEFAQVSGGDPQLASLIDAADADRKVYEQYLTRSNEISTHVGRLQPDARIVSTADVPLKPSIPETRLMVVVGAGIGAGIGLVLTVMIDGLLGGLRSAKQVEHVLGIRCLGLVPTFRRSRGIGSFAARLRGTIQYPSSASPRAAAFGQAIRGIQLKFVSVEHDSGSQVILVAAALPKEGKTWVATSLAVSLATEGFRVALVDCDLHRPAVHRMFDGPRGPGLTDYFAGRAGIDEVVHLDNASGVEYVPVGSEPSREAWYITFDRLRRLVAQLRRTHQFIILDSAPVLAVSETAMLSQIAQRTIFVVRWGRTPAKLVRHAVMHLFDSGAAEGAVVLSMVDVKWASKHGDLVAGAYKRLQNYYVVEARGRMLGRDR